MWTKVSRLNILVAAALLASQALAQTTRKPIMVAPSKPIDALALEVNATGFFINDTDVLTAQHVVASCTSLFLIKGGQLARAHLRAVSPKRDLAVITSSLKPLLAASFAQSFTMQAAQPAFVAGYDVLSHMPDRATTIYNALIRPDAGAQPGELTLISSATNGASGSPVLDRTGRIVGIVTERAEALDTDPRAYVMRSGAASYVIAVSADPIKAFLAANHVPFTETDAAQLEPMQAHAPRAATLEVGVLCAGPGGDVQ